MQFEDIGLSFQKLFHENVNRKSYVHQRRRSRIPRRWAWLIGRVLALHSFKYAPRFLSFRAAVRPPAVEKEQKRPAAADALDLRRVKGPLLTQSYGWRDLLDTGN